MTGRDDAEQARSILRRLVEASRSTIGDYAVHREAREFLQGVPTRAEVLLSTIAGMDRDGENGFEQTADDAHETLDKIIRHARSLDLPTGPVPR